jgi:Flp pilus assembly protein TadD
VLTFAAARALGLDAVMQEVQVPAVYDRRGSLDYVNHHVNVLVQVGADRPVLSLARYDDVIIDFEPEFASTARGQPLSDEAVLARYYNNMGVEALARRDWGNAYTHLRAAARVQPGYAPTYTNLAALYIERGLPAEAEQWLRHSVAASERPEHPLRALHQLVLGQGREREAEALDQRLRAWQQDDPYYWVSEGVRHLRESHPREAVRALERAQALTSGFTDVHRYLALAYWRLGESTRAQQQLQVLATINSNDPMGAKLRRKFNTGGTP